MYQCIVLKDIALTSSGIGKSCSDSLLISSISQIAVAA